MIYSDRPLPSATDDLAGLQARCATLADTSYGLSIIFAALAFVSAIGGVWLDQPLLATSCGFALLAAAAFAYWGHSIAQAGVRERRLRAVPIKPWAHRRHG